LSRRAEFRKRVEELRNAHNGPNESGAIHQYLLSMQRELE
jgi:hypothetical protein